MKVFVTGGNGFIGSAVVRTLAGRGDAVVCLLRASSDTSRIDDIPFTRAPGDVRDAASLRAAMRGCDCTVHLAAPSSWDGDNSPDVGTVIEGGTQQVLDVAGTLGDHRVVFVSSTAAVNASDRPEVFDEGTPFTITDPELRYAHAKHRAESRVQAAAARGVPVVTVNPAEVYGPGDTALNSASNLIDIVRSRPVLVCRGGTSVVHVADVAAGIVAALDRGRPGERYILAGDNLSIRQLAALCLDIAGRRAGIVTIPNGAVRLVARVGLRLGMPLPFNPHVIPYATRYWFVDNGKARRELGVSFRDARATIAPTLEWLAQKGLL